MSKEITETWAEFLARYPDLAFIKTKKQIYTAQEIDENIIYEEDTLPLIKGQTVIIPLDQTAYPECLKTGTAMEIGMWAISICERTNLEVKAPVIWEILKNQEAALVKEKSEKK